MFNALPIFLMIALIPFVSNDYLLAALYAVTVAISFFIYYERNDILAFIVGFVVVPCSEYLFLSTKVEVFYRHTLFGIMPFWLPILWGYVLVGIKRVVRALDR